VRPTRWPPAKATMSTTSRAKSAMVLPFNAFDLFPHGLIDKIISQEFLLFRQGSDRPRDLCDVYRNILTRAQNANSLMRASLTCFQSPVDCKRHTVYEN